MMTRYYCMKGCGQEYNTSNARSPAMPRGIGMGQGCPRCGTDHAVGTPTTDPKICRKCGLSNHVSATKLSPKHNGGMYAIKCIDCNRPTVEIPLQEANLQYCIRCGRLYCPQYARKNANGGVMKKCPHCGGATRFFVTA